jgi:uncharacterized membrane-anchored protein
MPTCSTQDKMPSMSQTTHNLTQALPSDDPQRALLHNEVHTRPAARIRLPALIVFIAVLNEGISREEECQHLNRLPGQRKLTPTDLQGNFLRLRFSNHTLKWERHSEFTRYSLVQAIPPHASLDAADPELLSSLSLDAEWLRAIPGRTIAAIKLVMLAESLINPEAMLHRARQWFGDHAVVASLMGHGHSIVVTDFRLRDSGFERMLVLAPADTSETRAGRISARLLELETYRMMALRGLPVAKELGPMLTESESVLSTITARLEGKHDSDQDLLDTLVSLAARVERATAEHVYRFSATQAYNALVLNRIAELREKPISGTQTVGGFMQRRLSPVIATLAATAQRISSLSQRIERAGGLLRTRVDIVTEAQNQQLLSKLTRGQELQLRLQRTVEGFQRNRGFLVDLNRTYFCIVFIGRVGV